jgi:transcription-repair coupling factor (superfamily II helicase)
MLEEEVGKLKGEPLPPRKDLTLHTSVPLAIPSDYIQEESLRLEMYRKLGEIDSIQHVNELRDEMIDRFGAIPSEVDRLLTAVKVKLLLIPLNIETVRWESRRLIIQPRVTESLNPQLLECAHRLAGQWEERGKADLRLVLSIGSGANAEGEMQRLTKVLEEVVGGD